MKNNQIILGISHGDINGIGYEVIIKALIDPRMLELCTPIIYGSPKVAAYHKKVIEADAFNFNQVRSVDELDLHKVNIVNCCDENVRVELGKISSLAGEAAYLALEHAVNDLKQQKIDVLVTAPINKESIQSKLFHFPGHTEYLAQQFEVSDPLMLLISEGIRVGVVVGHAPLRKVPELITKELIVSKLKTLHHSLVADFACTNPRIAVLGLNPHAGEQGILGMEEIEVITPVLEKLRGEGFLLDGPLPADTAFIPARLQHFDAVLAMYHDQGLPVLKYAGFDSAVNITLGLPYPRVAVDHGTALELAGQGIASDESLWQALQLCKSLALARKKT